MSALYSHTTRSTGTTLTAAIYNSDHTNHITNGIPSQLDDYSASVGEMQTTTSPGGVGTESQATSLAGEIERLRHVIKTMHGGAQWYPGTVLGPPILQTLADAAGDSIEASGADAWAKKTAYATLAAHATTCDPWNQRVTLLTGGAVTFTDLADADYVGQRALLLMNDAHTWTDGAVFDVQGGATYTTAAGDWVELVATAVDAFDVTIFPANGGVVASKGRVPITLVAQVAASGQTAIDFTGIPANVRRITIKFRGLSLSGTDKFLVQIGDAGGIETSGYVSTTASLAAAGTGITDSTAGFVLHAAAAGDVISGTMVLDLIDAATFAWVSSHSVKVATTAAATGGGDMALSAELTQVRITRTGTDTIDAGSVGISYE